MFRADRVYTYREERPPTNGEVWFASSQEGSVQYENLNGHLFAVRGGGAPAKEVRFINEFAARFLFAGGLRTAARELALAEYRDGLRYEGRVWADTAEKITCQNTERAFSPHAGQGESHESA